MTQRQYEYATIIRFIAGEIWLRNGGDRNLNHPPTIDEMARQHERNRDEL